MLHLANNLKLPTDYVTWKSAIIGRTGSGKTNTAVVLAEQMIDRGFPLAIIDPQGDWWGLRSKYKIAILGGEHGDIPLEPTAGELTADFLIAERIPVLLDLFSMGEGEMVRFATDFARRLWAKNREALHVFLDEADLFAPQKDTKGPRGVCLGAWQNIVRRGRSRGIGCTMITQRSAVINKDLLTQADPLIVHRLTAPQDLAAVEAYLDVHGADRQTVKDILAEVAKMPKGDAFVISPGTLGIKPTNIHVNLRKSFDSSATPEAGKVVAAPRDLATIDLKALSQQFASTIERAKADDPKELRRRIAELERELKTKPKAEPDQAAIDKAVAARDREWEKAINEQKRIADDFQGRLTKINQISHVNGEATPKIAAPEKVYATGKRFSPPHPPKAITKQVKISEPSGDVGTGGLRRILSALAQRPDGLSVRQIGVRAGLSSKSGTFGTYLGKARSSGWVEGSRDRLTITDAGLSALGDYDPLPKGQDLLDHWLRELGDSGAGRMLQAAAENYPNALSKGDLAEAAGLSASSGTFGTYLGKLRSLELVEGKSEIKASDELFE